MEKFIGKMKRRKSEDDLKRVQEDLVLIHHLNHDLKDNSTFVRDLVTLDR